jgi:hypothetical protein
MQQNVKKRLVAGLVAVEVVSAVLAWLDLNRRADDQIRGTRKLWRVIIVANPGNSIAYWILGRR